MTENKKTNSFLYFGCYNVCFLIAVKGELLLDVKSDPVSKRIEQLMAEIEKIVDEEKGIMMTKEDGGLVIWLKCPFGFTNFLQVMIQSQI